jgi:hypothetical protein
MVEGNIGVSSNLPSGIYFIGIETYYGISSRQVVPVRE